MLTGGIDYNDSSLGGQAAYGSPGPRTSLQDQDFTDYWNSAGQGAWDRGQTLQAQMAWDIANGTNQLLGNPSSINNIANLNRWPTDTLYGGVGTSTLGGETQRTPIYQPRYQYQQPIYVPVGGQQQPLQGKIDIDLSGFMGSHGQDMGPQMAALLAIANQNKPHEPLNYKPYNDILQRFPTATAQAVGGEGYGQRPRVVSDVPELPDLDAIRRAKGYPDEGLIAQKPSLAPTGDDVNRALATQVHPEQPQYAPEDNPTPPPVAQQPQQGQYSPTGYGPTDLMYAAQPQFNPQYAYAMQQQRALQAQMQAQAMMGPPQYRPMNPTPIMPPGGAHGWQGFVQRGAMLNPNIRRQYGNMYQQQMHQQEVAMQMEQQRRNQEMMNYRAQMQGAMTGADAMLNDAGANARGMQQLVGGIVRDMIKEVSKQPTGEKVYEEGMKMVDKYPPGPMRDAVIQNAAAYGLDLRGFRNTPMSPKAVTQQEGRELTNDAKEQKLEFEKKMNPFKLSAAQMRNSRMAATNDSYIKLTEAKAQLAQMKVVDELAYGDQKQQLDLQAKQKKLEGQVFQQTNSALAKANAVNMQYESALKDYLNTPKADQPKALKNIEARFGKLDPDTDLPQDVLDNRKIARQLTGELNAMQQQSAGQQPAPRPMAQQQQKVAPQAAPPKPQLTTEMISTYMAKAQAALPPGSDINAIRAKASALAKQDGLH